MYVEPLNKLTNTQPASFKPEYNTYGHYHDTANAWKDRQE